MKQQQSRHVRRVLGLVLAALLLLLCGCHTVTDTPDPDDTEKEYPVFVGSITLTAAPQRVVVLSPVIADWIEELSLTDSVIGCVSEGMSDAFSRASDIGSTLSPDLDAVASLQPDLILAQATSDLTATFIQVNHIPCITLDSAATLTELNSRYHALATALDGAISGARRAQSQYADLTQKLNEIKDTVGTPEVSYTTVFATSLYGHVATGDTLLHELMTIAGAVNVAKAGTTWQMPPYNGNIQVIFCPASIKDELIRSKLYKDTHAVKNGRVYTVDDALLNQQGNGLVTLTEQMAKALNPTLFATTQ